SPYRCADRWVKVKVGKGRYISGKGRENLYEGVVPQRWADELRRRMLGGIEIKPDEGIREVDDAMGGEYGGSDGYPATGTGVSHRHLEGDRDITQTPPGYHTDTRTSDYHLKKKVGVPPVNGVSHRHRGSRPQTNGKAEMAAQLNPASAERKAY